MAIHSESSKKNILLVINDLTGGGAELIVCLLCKYLNRELFNVTVCHLKERGYRGEELYRTGYDIIGLSENFSGKTDYFSFRRLRRIVKKRKIDIIHSHSTDSLIDASMCRLTIRNLKTIHTFHFGNYPNLRKKYLYLERIFSRVPDKLVAVGEVQKRNILNTFKLNENAITTIWNGVSIINPKPKSQTIKELISKEKFIIGSVSTLFFQKGLSYLLDAAAILKKKKIEFILVIAGDGPLRNELNDQCQKLMISEDVIFLGWVKDVSTKILPYFDIFIQSSLWEAMSMVILEAMASGKAIIATDVGDNRYVIDQGKSGLIVEPGNAEMLFQSIKKLIDDDKLREKLGKNALLKYKKKFKAEIMAAKYENLYSEVYNRGRTEL